MWCIFLMFCVFKLIKLRPIWIQNIKPACFNFLFFQNNSQKKTLKNAFFVPKYHLKQLKMWGIFSMIFVLKVTKLRPIWIQNIKITLRKEKFSFKTSFISNQRHYRRVWKNYIQTLIQPPPSQSITASVIHWLPLSSPPPYVTILSVTDHIEIKDAKFRYTCFHSIFVTLKPFVLVCLEVWNWL